MDKDRIIQLEKLGMIWSHYDVAWGEGLTAARGWAAKAGHPLGASLPAVPRHRAGPDEVRCRCVYGAVGCVLPRRPFAWATQPRGGRGRVPRRLAAAVRVRTASVRGARSRVARQSGNRPEG